jgi:hypothetical protein
MIRPNRKKLDMAGVQGKIAFDPTKSDVDVKLYNEIRKFMQGEMGLGGAGGTLANKLQTPKSFQASHVFGSPDEREKVTERLNTQMTEFLQEKVGAQAIKANMTIPGFLQTKGIHGINQIGTGDDAKLSAYRRDDFVKVSQNPITGSTEKLARAALKGFGAVHEVSGGTNEKRTLTAFMRPEEAKQINKMVDNTVKKVDLGLHSKGDMEPIFGTTAQREAFRLKHKTSKNELALNILNDEQNPATKEAKSRLLKQHAQKKALLQAKEELYDSGELERPEKKGSSAKEKVTGQKDGSSFGALFKAAMITVMRIGTMVRSMVGFLTKIAMDLGKTISAAQTAGVDPNTADRLVRYANQNKVFSYGNPHLHLDALNAIQAKFGNAELMQNQKFSDAERSKSWKGMIKPLVEHRTHMDTLKTADKVYKEASHYVISRSSDGKINTKAMAEAKQGVSNMVDPTVGESWAAAFNIGVNSNRINLNNKEQAYKYTSNLLSNESAERNLRHLSTGGDVGYLTRQGLAPGGIEKGARDINEVLADVQKVFDSLRMMLLEETKLLQNALELLVGAILKILVFFNVPGSKEKLAEFKNVIGKKAEKDFAQHLTVTLQFKALAEKKVDQYLEDIKVPKAERAEARARILKAIDENNPEALKGSKFENFAKSKFGADAINAEVAYLRGLQLANENAQNLKEGVSSVEGSDTQIINWASSKIRKVRADFGIPVTETSLGGLMAEAKKMSTSQKAITGAVEVTRKGTLSPEMIKKWEEYYRKRYTEFSFFDIGFKSEESYIKEHVDYIKKNGKPLKEFSDSDIPRPEPFDIFSREEVKKNLDDQGKSKSYFEELRKKSEEAVKKAKEAEKDTSRLPNNVSEGLASLGAYPSKLIQGMSTMSNEVGGSLSKSPIDIATNVHITMNGETILAQTNLENESRRRDYFANVSTR